MNLTRSDLSPDQRRVYESMLDWVKTPNSPLLTIGGYAGTGKSTLLGLFAAETDLRVAYICFTGRASSILGRKLNAGGVATTNRICTDDDSKLDGPWSHLFYSSGSPESKFPFSGTIHRLLYRPFIDSVTEELLGWEKRIELDRNYDLVVIDEASMVDAKIIADIQTHGVRIMAVGDHGQLPPVMSEGSLVSRPMLRLEKIHRQAEGSPIIQLSRILREEGRLARELADGDQLRFGSARDIYHPSLGAMLSREKLDAAVLCWRNATRVNVNRTVREHLGFAGKPPQAGEPLIALRNYPPVYNGMRGLLTEEATSPYKEEWWLMKAKIEFPDEGLPEKEHEICRDQFHRARPFESIDEMKAAGIDVHSMGGAGRLMDFGYAMTVHKCVDPETLVETPEGLLRIEQLNRNFGIIATPTGPQEYERFIENGTDRLLEIRSKDGYRVSVTPEHGLDVWTDLGFRRVEANLVRPGDILRLRLGVSCKPPTSYAALPDRPSTDVRAVKHRLPKKITADVAEFFGLMVADGTVFKGGFRLVKRHQDVLDRFRDLCRSLFGAKVTEFMHIGTGAIEVCSTEIVSWLRKVGGMSPNQKSVPEGVLRSPMRIQSSFLKGLFEDGTVNLKNGGIDHIELYTVFPKLEVAVRTMLLRFGIISGGTSKRPGNIYIYGVHAKKFKEKIGFISKFKNDRLKLSAGRETKYVIPLTEEESKQITGSLLRVGAITKSTFGNIRLAKNISRRVAREALQLASSEDRAFLKDRLSFHYTRVDSILKKIGPSMCVEVPVGNRFLQNGFCGWNSQGSQFKHAVVVVDWRQDYSNENTKRLCYTAITRASEKLSVLL